MDIDKPVRWGLYIETAPCLLKPIEQHIFIHFATEQGLNQWETLHACVTTSRRKIYLIDYPLDNVL